MPRAGAALRRSAIVTDNGFARNLRRPLKPGPPNPPATGRRTRFYLTTLQ